MSDLDSNYEPRIYWPRRYRQQGASYVGPGGREDLVEEQAKRFRDAISWLMEDQGFGYLLDFGCGPGRMTQELKLHSAQYLGVDIVEGAIREAREVHKESLILQFHWMDEDLIPFQDGSFDLIACLAVLQHVVDPESFSHWIQEIKRVLMKEKRSRVLIIDTEPHGNAMDPHMMPRTPETVAAAFGMDIVGVLPVSDKMYAMTLCLSDEELAG